MLLRPRGSAIVSPSRMLARALRMAFSTVRFPAVLETMFSPSKMGTPLLTSVPKRSGEPGHGYFLKEGPKDWQFQERRSMISFPVFGLIIFPQKINAKD